MLYLLDTNVLCEPTARDPDPRVMTWLEQHSDQCALSSLSLGEIWKGIHLLPRGKRRKSLSTWAEQLESDFTEVTLPLSTVVMKTWAAFYAAHEAKGRNLVLLGSLIAATAITHDLIVATRNTRDFPSGVKTLNPWSP